MFVHSSGCKHVVDQTLIFSATTIVVPCLPLNPIETFRRLCFTQPEDDEFLESVTEIAPPGFTLDTFEDMITALEETVKTMNPELLPICEAEGVFAILFNLPEV